MAVPFVKHDLSIRSWVLLLLVVSMAPALGGIVAVVSDRFGREQAHVEQARVETARALMQAVDRELSRAQGILLALSSSSSLQEGDLSAFYSQAKAVQANDPNHNFVLCDASGQQLLNTLRPYGARLPHHGNPAQLRVVFASARPVVSDLYLGDVTRRPVISIDVPVLRHGRPVYDLSMRIPPIRFYDVLHLQRSAPDTVAAIFDSRGVIVARTWEQDKYVGDVGAPALVRRMREVAEDSIEVATLEGVPVLFAFSRSSVSRWSVAIGVRRSELARARWASLQSVVGVAVLALLAGMALSVLAAERLAAPIRGLRALAKALGEGRAVEPVNTAVREVNDVARGLGAASRLLRTRTVERDRAEQAERDLCDTQERLRRSEGFERRLFDEAPEAVLLMNAAGCIVRASLAAETIFGYTNAQLLALRVEDLVPAWRHGALRGACFTDPMRRPVGAGLDLRARRADGGEFPAEISLSPFRDDSGQMALATVRDVTRLRRDEAILKAALREKETLLKELYHRVKNNLQVIASMIRMQGRASSSDPIRDALDDTARWVRAMALVHEMLYQSADLSSIALDAYMVDLCKQLGDAAGARQRGIAIECRAEAVAAGLDAAIPLGLIINELVSNCLKHAFPDGGPGLVRVRLERGVASLCLSVADDGRGMAANQSRTVPPSLGLKLIEALSTQLGGEFTVRSNGGTVARLVLPWPDAPFPHQTRGDSQ